MHQSDAGTAISPHTEYSHGRVRCPRCGTVVPDDPADERACGHCETT